MKRLIFLFLLIATPAVAWDGSGWDTGSRIVTTPDGATTTLDGPVTVGESLGSELLTQTCAGWGLSSPVGAWSCSGDTITRTASGSDLTITNTAGVAGDQYKLTMVAATVTAGSFTIKVGGVSCATVTAARTQTCYVPSGTTGNVTITAVAASAGTITVSGTSAKRVTSEIRSSAGPVVVNADLTSATENEAAMVLNYVTNKSAGNDTGLQINMIDTASPATSYPIEVTIGGGQAFSVNQAGSVLSNGVIRAAYSAPTTGSIIVGEGVTMTTNNGTSSYFTAIPTLGAMNGSDTVNVFNSGFTNGNHTSTGNAINAFNAANITGDAECTETAVKIGTGWDVGINVGSGGILVTPTAAQTIAAGNTVAADACGGIKQITAGGAVTTDTTNTFTAPGAANTGCCMDVINVGSQNITLDNNGNFFSAGAGDVVLGANDTVRVCSNGTYWFQIGATGNN